jgi:hypothetical protein
MAWATCPSAPEQAAGQAALPWDAEIAELKVQLDSFTWHGSELLPSALVQQVMGVSPSALSDRYDYLAGFLCTTLCVETKQRVRDRCECMLLCW